MERRLWWNSTDVHWAVNEITGAKTQTSVTMLLAVNAWPCCSVSGVSAKETRNRGHISCHVDEARTCPSTSKQRHQLTYSWCHQDLTVVVTTPEMKSGSSPRRGQEQTSLWLRSIAARHRTVRSQPLKVGDGIPGHGFLHASFAILTLGNARTTEEPRVER